MEIILDSIFSTEFFFSVLRVATPLIFVSLAALVVKNGGVMCIAFEGMMLFSALGAVIGSAFSQSRLVGILVGLLLGMSISAIFAYFVLVLNSNGVLTGLALNILGSGGTVFMLYLISGDKGSSTALKSLIIPNVDIPIIKDIPVIGEILSGHNILTYVALITVVVVYILINKTPLGLRIRSVGENPHAAESVGIKVIKTKFIALMIGGFIASLGGIYMSMGYLPFFTRDMMAGRGFMGIAASNLGGGLTIPTFAAALLFGSAEALSNIMQSLRLPSEFMQMVPYIVTLIGLMLVGGNNKKLTFKKEEKNE
jgi:simple sugar transport system permease protein